ncbi:VRR-NUC domain-containing protein [Trametes meyenii]|nr:VRR-NUC domain-containing protein [Trametes meyenii]
MVLGSPSASLANKLVFSSPGDDSQDDDDSQNEDTHSEYTSMGAEHGIGKKESMYVKIFEEMLMEILLGEGRLFVREELNCFMKYHRLPYHAKYLFCRLCLRKTDRWLRLSKLQYEGELGGLIPAAMDILCAHLPAEELVVKTEVEDPGIVIPDSEPSFQINAEPQVKPEPDIELETCAGALAQALFEAETAATSGADAQASQSTPPKDKAEPVRPPNHPTVKVEEHEVIDLTFDEDEDDPPPLAGPSRSPEVESTSSSSTTTPPTAEYSVFADDEEQASLSDLLDCLTLDELGDLAKQLHLKVGPKKRDVIIDNILRTSSTQGTLRFPMIGKGGKKLTQSTLPFGDASKGKLRQTMLPFKPQLDPRRTQLDHVRKMVMKKLGKCIRLNADVVALFRRANLVYFRSTQYTPELLTPALLSRSKKRVYAAYPYARTTDIWRSRAELLAYEEALRIEAEVDALLEFSEFKSNRGRGSTRDRSAMSMSMTPGPGCTVTPATPARAGKGKRMTAEEEPGEVEGTVREQNARKVVMIYEAVYPQWVALVGTKPDVEDGEAAERRKALQRFECGHILTRIVCKGAHALGLLKRHTEELALLDTLLAQTRWRRGRRGRWHERRALVLMHHLHGAAAGEPKEQRALDRRALAGVVAALEDADTHVVFRPMLERRLTRLERRLGVDGAERHVCTGGLEKADPVGVEGVRVYKKLVLDEEGRIVKQSEGDKKGALDRWVAVEHTQKPKEEPRPEKATGKSIWKGRDGEDVSVEMLALQHYEDRHGYQGFHCEGRIVTTLFGLLFWDIIFAPVPGAFETKYQAAPLDLAEDTFYYARQTLADARLAEIEAGRAADILERTHDAHKDVVCVGVRWDMFTKEQLVGIVKCLRPRVLSVICRLMCEDYAGRTGGVPDLIVWNEERCEAKFVEVKGPNDSLQENQKVWIDVLLQAGQPVEVCHVYEEGKPPKVIQRLLADAAKTPRKSKTGSGTRKRKQRDTDDEERVLESEDEGCEVDYSQLDRPEDEEEEETPVKKKPRRNPPRAASNLRETESPVARKVARLNSQPEMIPARPLRTRRPPA